MALSTGARANFETLLAAAKADDLALVECTDRESGTLVPVLCAVNADNFGGYVMVPLAAMATENPYDIWDPPTTDMGDGDGNEEPAL